MKNATVVISQSSLVADKFYSHSFTDTANGYTQNNRTRFFAACKALLGSDYTKWIKNPHYEAVARAAHENIYGRSASTFKLKSGLGHQIQFLIYADRELKNNSHNGYEQAVASAIDAGVITADLALSWR